MAIGRRTLIGAGGAALAAGIAGFFGLRGGGSAEAQTNPLARTDAEWRRMLSPEQYRVQRRAGTERAGSSPLDRERRRGTFVCAGCALPLFRSADKYESGTGWPSFTRPISGAVGTRPDDSLFMRRTEAHCRRCGGHLGHVFDDGPPPTGQRWCMNGVAMRFVAA